MFQIHEYAFGYCLYPLHNFVLCCSIYVTVALALERYRAVWRPVEYHNKCKGVNPWRRVVLSYVMPVVIFSVLFNIPKFFESSIEYETFEMAMMTTTTNATMETTTTATMTTNATLETTTTTLMPFFDNSTTFDETYNVRADVKILTKNYYGKYYSI